MKRITYKYGMDSREIDNLVSQGYQLTCPRCNSDLDVALTFEEAREKKIRGGVFCPINENHVAILYEFAEPHLQMRKLFAEMQEKWELEHPDKVVK